METIHIIFSLIAFAIGIFLTLTCLAKNKTRQAIFGVLFIFSVTFYALFALVGVKLLN